jgi:hypothetical protein
MPTSLQARATLLVLALLATAGIALGWNKGQLPRREVTAPTAQVQRIEIVQGALNAPYETPPDLALYRDVIHDVRCGANYYDAAKQRIPQYGFPIGSPLNWRLPTYAWLFSMLPNKCWVQAVLLLLAVTGLFLAFRAQCRTSGVGYAGLTTFLLFGVVRWTFDGEAYLAQEVWAAVLILISLGAHALGSQQTEKRRNGEMEKQEWRWVAIVAGLAALFFRELALPYCGAAFVLAGWNRRWREAVMWGLGIIGFFAFFTWHVAQVRAQLAGTEVVASAGIGQWLRFGGLDFVLLTTRMNSLLFGAPGWLLWLYVLAALIGLARRADETSRLACLAALAYMAAFAIIGRPENFYWGLLPAPLLAWGTVDGIRAIAGYSNEKSTDAAGDNLAPDPAWRPA